MSFAVEVALYDEIWCLSGGPNAAYIDRSSVGSMGRSGPEGCPFWRGHDLPLKPPSAQRIDQVSALSERLSQHGVL